jgi:DNA replication protein DnaC
MYDTSSGMNQIQQFIERFTSEKIGEPYTMKPPTLEEQKAKYQWKADIVNSQPGYLRYVDCPKCMNRGYTAYINDDLVETFKTCECMKKRECYQMMERSGINPDMLRRFTFQNFEDDELWQKDMKFKAMQYAKSDLSEWLVLSGQSGAGKTHLCTAVSKYLLSQGHEVKYMLWSDIARRLAALKFREAEYDEFFHKIVDAEVLYIDDFLKTYKDTDTAFEVINARYAAREKRSTIISMEMNLESIRKINEALAGRIVERSENYCYQIKQDPKRNYRYRRKNTE